MWKNLNALEKRTMIGCFAGWSLDALDAQAYSFVMPALLGLWGISRGQAGMLGTVTLLVSAFGGWFVGMFSDRYGRVRVLQITVVWYAVFTFLSGFTQNFEQLFVCRALQGLGFGGEWAAGAVLIGEVIRDEYRGRAVGIVQSGWAIGWGAAALLFGVVFSRFPDALAWRIMFWTGLLPAFGAIWMRGKLREPEASAPARQAARNTSVAAQIGIIFTRPYLATTIKAAALATGATGGSYSFVVWLPTYLKTVRHMSVIGTTAFTTVLIAGSFVGFLAGAYLCDAIGRRRTFMVSTIGSAIMLVLYMGISLPDNLMLVLGFPLGFCAYMMFSPMGPYMTELFPSAIRGTAQGFCYNFGRGIGALFPGVIGLLGSMLPLGGTIVAFGVSAYAIMLIAIALLPETAGRALDAGAPSVPASESEESYRRELSTDSR
ncbi:MFS transporter [Paraburkholderia sp. ZP32-5]|uniref:MFS transporter n=1 Tax=Paraburkholderia sp. ZP32-5 TaxID=2883245 RepID=UPI001F2C8867|nr:MFS transporter [Paraburkholderia sp. ZP32-5]